MAQIHTEPHEWAGKTVQIQRGSLQGAIYTIEDWWDRVGGGGWRDSGGNFACIVYGMRIGVQDQFVPQDDEVVYGKVDGLGHLVHVDELVLSD